MKFNFIYVAILGISCLIVGILTVTGVQSAKNVTKVNNIQVESSARNESNESKESGEVKESSSGAETKESSTNNETSECNESEEHSIDNNVYELAKKPVIYIYSDVDDKYVEVSLDTQEKMLCEYPKRDENGIWKVVVNRDGSVTDLDGKEYNYLFWEAENTVEYDFSKGFCIKGSDSREFLDKALKDIGLNRKEANEFIIYWLPQLEANEWNLISFQTDKYTENYDLRVHPHCDNMLRVFMTFKKVDGPVEIKKQDLSDIKGNFRREGLHIVEWGGSKIK